MAGDFQEGPLQAVGLDQLGVCGLELGHQPVPFDDQVVPLHGLTNHGFQLFRLPGLGDVAEDMALVDRVDDGVDIGVSGEEEPRGLRADGLRPMEDLHAGHAGHPLVREDHGDLGVGLEVLDGLGPAVAGHDLVLDPEQVVDRVQDFLLVVDHQHRGASASGCMVDVPSRAQTASARRKRAAVATQSFRAGDPVPGIVTLQVYLLAGGMARFRWLWTDVAGAGRITDFPAGANRLMSVTSLPGSL